MANEAIDIGVVKPAPQDEKPDISQNLQQSGVNSVHEGERIHDEITNSLKESGADFHAPEIPHTATTGKGHEQFEVKPKFKDTARWGASIMEEKRIKTENYASYKSNRGTGIFENLKNLFGGRKEELRNAT